MNMVAETADQKMLTADEKPLYIAGLMGKGGTSSSMGRKGKGLTRWELWQVEQGKTTD